MALNDDELDHKAEEIVLQILHNEGIIAFDVEDCILEPEIEELIQGEG